MHLLLLKIIDSTTSTHIGKRKGGKVSELWQCYTKFENDTKCKCKYYFKVYAYHSRLIETHTLWNHLLVRTIYANRKVDLKKPKTKKKNLSVGG